MYRRVKLRDPRWQKRRLEIYNRDNFACTKCGDTKTTLAVHHLYYVGNPWDAPDNALKTVCEDCHFIIEDIKNFNIPIKKFTYETGHVQVFAPYGDYITIYEREVGGVISGKVIFPKSRLKDLNDLIL
jgi:hypothetical protein